MTWTLDDIAIKIRKDLKIESEKFFSPWEMTSAINDAIRDAESIIINEFSDFFLTYADYDLTAGDTFITMPSDVYMARIRYVQWDEDGPDDNTNNDTYHIKKIRLEEIPWVCTDDRYKYRLLNDATNGLVMNLYPAIQETGTNRIRVWYIRKAKQLSALTDVCDIPFIGYVISHVKLRVMFDEGHPLLEIEKVNFDNAKMQLIKNVTVMADDGEDSKFEPSNDTLIAYNEME